MEEEALLNLPLYLVPFEDPRRTVIFAYAASGLVNL